jgi:hypothetical protein
MLAPRWITAFVDFALGNSRWPRADDAISLAPLDVNDAEYSVA